MSYLYGFIVTAILSVAAWVYSLIQRNHELAAKAVQAIVDAEEREWADKIAAQSGKVNEETRDYDKAKKDFNDKFGTGDGGSGKPS